MSDSETFKAIEYREDGTGIHTNIPAYGRASRLSKITSGLPPFPSHWGMMTSSLRTTSACYRAFVDRCKKIKKENLMRLATPQRKPTVEQVDTFPENTSGSCLPPICKKKKAARHESRCWEFTKFLFGNFFVRP